MSSHSNPFGRSGWTPARLPSVDDAVVVITGANSGIGLEAARELAPRGVHQLWLCRNLDKANVARDSVLAETPTGKIDIIEMDLSDLDSVARAAATVRDSVQGIDALINNAGIMMLPSRQLTAQGLEKQIGVNHFGHFALNGHLADLVEANAGRFVSGASLAHKGGEIHRSDVSLEKNYSAIRSYSQSKLANLLYILELDRRLKDAGRKSSAIACHPGYSSTNLQTTGPSAVWGAIMTVSNALMAQKAERGAWPTLLAAFDVDAERSQYYGPTGMAEARGAVGVASRSAAATDAETAQWLWDRSVELTGVDWSTVSV
jgi:NAD(P)-dependent dehydrogenase (short-subunit alcohol dehydrogenase family)